MERTLHHGLSSCKRLPARPGDPDTVRAAQPPETLVENTASCRGPPHPARSRSAAGGSVLLALCGRPLALLEGNEVLVAHTCLVSVVSCGRGLFYFPVQGPQASLVIRV